MNIRPGTEILYRPHRRRASRGWIIGEVQKQGQLIIGLYDHSDRMRLSAVSPYLTEIESAPPTGYQRVDLYDADGIWSSLRWPDQLISEILVMAQRTGNTPQDIISEALSGGDF